MTGFFLPSQVQKDQPPALAARCGACGLYKSCQSPKMEPHGRGERRVLVVGEAPGQTEDEEGRPFVGKAGQFLRQTLAQFGFSLDRDAVTTNALICRPPGNATPDPKQIDHCRPNVLKTISEHQPRVIVTLGRSALTSVIVGYWRDVKTLERWVGWRIPLERHWVCPTYHPSFLLRMNNPSLDRLFASHLKAAFSIERDPPPARDYGGHVEVLYDQEQACAAVEEMGALGGWQAFDYETNCLKPDYPKARIHSCAISNGKRTVSFLWRGRVPEVMRDYVRSKRVVKIASNLKFEERWTRKEYGHGVRRWGWDTMLAAHCLDNRPDICSLKFQSLVRLGVPTYNDQVEPYLFGFGGHYNRVQHIDTKTLLLYGGMDAVLEYRLAMRQRKDMGYED